MIKDKEPVGFTKLHQSSVKFKVGTLQLALYCNTVYPVLGAADEMPEEKNACPRKIDLDLAGQEEDLHEGLSRRVV